MTPSADGRSPVLTLEGVSKAYGAVRAVDDVSLCVHEGEVLGLIGPSGSGKTTLLRCIDLLERADSGTIWFPEGYRLVARTPGITVLHARGMGEEELDEANAVGVRRQMGYVFQQLNLWEDKDVLTNLTLAPIVVNGEPRREVMERARVLCKEFGLTEKERARPWQLSGGQRQRVSIMRALMMAPKILLLDEITSALDPVLTFEVMQAIRVLRQKRLSMVIVTHHLKFAASVCDRIGFLSSGRLIQLDTPDQMKESPATPEIKRFLEVLEEAS